PRQATDTAPDAAARALRFLGDRRPAAAQAAGGGAGRVLDHRELRGLGHRTADAPSGPAGAHPPAACSRRRDAAPHGVPLCHDVPHWSWHEYGMRVGAWRLFELYERLGIRPTLAINARTCEDYARVAEEGKRLGWEFMGHAYDQMPIHKVEDQAGMINRSMDLLERFTGKRPVGWLGPDLTQTFETPELLVDAGVKYIGDWVYDDEPIVIRTAKGPLVTLPYTVEIKDIMTI